MTRILSRRSFVISLSALATTTALPGLPAVAASPEMIVAKDPNCGCCGAWIDILQKDGFRVSTRHVDGDALARLKAVSGVPEGMTSCHTARVGDYIIEGHVPAADIRRILSDRPDAVGLSVPGMPWGSPGMGPESEREAYDVFLIKRDGSVEVFQRYDGAS